MAHRDNPPWYYRAIAPIFYVQAAVFAVGSVFFLARWASGRDVLIAAGESTGAAMFSFWFARWCYRHAAKLERVNNPTHNQDAPSESN